jgi:hypothetical protein
MSNLPLRQLGSVGVITDASPYDLPPNAFSAAVNVIFTEGRVSRAPVFKALFPAIMSPLTYAEATGTYAANPNIYEAAQGGSPANSSFVGCYTDPAAGETVFVCDNDGTVRSYPNGNLDIVSPATGVLTGTVGAKNAGTGKLAFTGSVSSDTAYTVNFPTASTYTVTTAPAVSENYSDSVPIALATGLTLGLSGEPNNGDSFTVVPSASSLSATPAATNIGTSTASAVTAPNPLTNTNSYEINFNSAGTLTTLQGTAGLANTGGASLGTITAPNPLTNALEYGITFSLIANVIYYTLTTFNGVSRTSGQPQAYTSGAAITLGTGVSVVVNGQPNNGDFFLLCPVAVGYTLTTISPTGTVTGPQLTYTSGGTITLMSGETFQITGQPSIYDSYSIVPVYTWATTPNSANTGTGVAGSVTVPTPLPNLDSYLVSLEEVQGITSYSVSSITPSAPYTSGAAITLTSGVTATITGAPVAGDTFSVSPTGVLVTNGNPWTHAQVAGVSYLARQGMLPYVRNIETDATYSPIGGDWVSTDQAAIVREYMDFAIMMNVNRNGLQLPTMVKWNNPAEYSSPVADIFWNPANPNYISGENTIGEMKDAIRDGLTLGANFVIYSQNQMWMMSYTGGEEVFYFQRIPYEGGIVNANCVVEIESKHYVFGDNDIYVHDGLAYKSLADARVRRRIFNTLDRSKQGACFVSHDPVAKLIHFCYRTLQDEAAFAGASFCNQSASYSYKDDTWSFMDLPNIVGGTSANAALVADTFGQNTNSYELYNTPYTSFSGGGTPRISVMLGVYDQAVGLSASRVYAIDLPQVGIVNLPACAETFKEAYVERTGLSLDIKGIPLRQYKLVQSAMPLATFQDTEGVFTIQFGSSDLPEQTPSYRASSTYDPNTDYKVDMMIAGRFLAYKVSTSSITDFEFSGMDLEVKPMGRR